MGASWLHFLTVREWFPKKAAVLLDFVQMRGGTQLFGQLFISAGPNNQVFCLYLRRFFYNELFWMSLRTAVFWEPFPKGFNWAGKHFNGQTLMKGCLTYKNRSNTAFVTWGNYSCRIDRRLEKLLSTSFIHWYQSQPELFKSDFSHSKSKHQASIWS